LENYCGYKGETTENIPIWLEKVWHGRKITVDGRRQIPTWWEISLRGWEKVFRHIGHLVCYIHRIGGNFPSPFLSVYLGNRQSVAWEIHTWELPPPFPSHWSHKMQGHLPLVGKNATCPLIGWPPLPTPED
jgi:hypothetical protein